MTTTTILHAAKLCLHYPDRALLTDFSMDIPAGVTMVRGGDGRGKTSLLRLLAGDLSADSGVLAINAVALAQEPQAYRQQVYYVDPRTEAFDQMTVPDYFASVRQRFTSFDEARLESAVAGLSLTPQLEKKLFMLSTGSKRKVYLAGAFAAGARVNMLDDPFAGLDRSSINFVISNLNALAANPQQAWIVALYEAVEGLQLVAQFDLGD